MSDNWADILIVEDERKLRQFTSDILKFEGVRTATAEDGCKALDYFNTVIEQGGKMPRLVLLDMTMPCMTGREVYEAIATTNWIQDVIVIVTSATNEDFEELPGPARTVNMHKPYDVKMLIGTIRELAPELFASTAS